jgi:hypothetical protein
MSRITKLTPAVLKKIIKEEKQKLANSTIKEASKKSAKKSKEPVNEITKLALMEMKYLLELKRIRRKRQTIKNRLSKK